MKRALFLYFSSRKGLFHSIAISEELKDFRAAKFFDLAKNFLKWDLLRYFRLSHVSCLLQYQKGRNKKPFQHCNSIENAKKKRGGG